MFSIVPDGEVRRLPGRFQVPWNEIGLVVVVLAILAVLSAPGVQIVSRDGGVPAPQAVEQQPVAVPAVPNPQAPQYVQGNVGAVTPVVVDYRVVWTEVQGFDPSTIPVEEGFYSGAFPQEVSWSPSNPNSIPVGDAYAWKILPHLQETGRGTRVAAARDQDNKAVVLVSIDALRYGDIVLLSLDEEKSWYKLNLLPRETNPTIYDVRVVSTGDEIRLYGLDGRPGNHWWTATVKKSELS